MEEDIKILEDYIKDKTKPQFEWAAIRIKEIDAIQNLIARNKELEAIEKEHQIENGELREQLKDSIPKSKVREKIEEIRKAIQKEEEETSGRCITIGKWETVKYLQKLLQEE